MPDKQFERDCPLLSKLWDALHDEIDRQLERRAGFIEYAIEDALRDGYTISDCRLETHCDTPGVLRDVLIAGGSPYWEQSFSWSASGWSLTSRSLSAADVAADRSGKARDVT